MMSAKSAAVVAALLFGIWSLFLKPAEIKANAVPIVVTVGVGFYYVITFFTILLGEKVKASDFEFHWGYALLAAVTYAFALKAFGFCVESAGKEELTVLFVVIIVLQVIPPTLLRLATSGLALSDWFWLVVVCVGAGKLSGR